MGFGIYLRVASGKLVANGTLLHPKKMLRLEIMEARNAGWIDEEKRETDTRADATSGDRELSMLGPS